MLLLISHKRINREYMNNQIVKNKIATKINTISGDLCAVSKNKFVYCKSDNADSIKNPSWFTVIKNEDGTYSLKQGDYYCLHDRKTKGIVCNSPTWTRASDYNIGLHSNGWNFMNYKNLPCFIADDYYLKCTNLNNPPPDAFSDRNEMQFNFIDFSKNLIIRLDATEKEQKTWVSGKWATPPSAHYVNKTLAFDLTHDYLVNAQLNKITIGQNYTFCAWVKWQISNHPRVVLTLENGNFPLVVGNNIIGGSDLKKKYYKSNIIQSKWCFVGFCGKTNRAYHTRTYFYATENANSVEYVGSDNKPLNGQKIIAIGGNYNFLGHLAAFWYLDRTLTHPEIDNLFTHTVNTYKNS